MRPRPGEVRHFSEDPTIAVFQPHVAPTAQQPEAYVWAVDYWFPRPCAWAEPTRSLARGTRPGMGHADPVEPIFRAVLADDVSAIIEWAPGANAQRMEQDVLLAEVPHWLYRGDTPLHLAAAGLRLDAARALLDAGVAVDAVNRRGAAALHYACDPRPAAANWDPVAQRSMVELLVARGATVDLADRGGVTALHRAVRARSPVAVAALLAAGADPRAATRKSGSTALHLAVAPSGAGGTAGTEAHQLEIVRMLLAAGATLTDVDRNGIAVVDRIRSRALRDALR